MIRKRMWSVFACLLISTCLWEAPAKQMGLSALDTGETRVSYGNEVSLSEEFEVAKNLMSVINHNGDCLSESETQKLSKAIGIIDEVMSGVSDALTSAAETTDKTALKHKLLESAEILNKVKLDIVDKLTGVVEEACGTCSDIVQTVNDSVQILIQALVDIEPVLKDTKWFNFIVTAANTALAIARDVCETNTAEFIQFPLSLKATRRVRPMTDNEFNGPGLFLFTELESKVTGKCLSKDQEDDVDEILQLVGNVLNTFSDWLRESESKAKTKELKEVIDRIANILASERDLLEKHGEQVVEKLCEGCATIAHYSEKVVAVYEKILGIVFPLWRHIPFADKVSKDIDALLKKAEEICPYEYHASEILRNEFRSCLPIGVTKEIQSEVNALMTEVKQNTEFSSVNLMDMEGLNSACVSCSKAIIEVESFFEKVEKLLDEHLPRWKDCPLAEFIEESMHKILQNIKSHCPNSYVPQEAEPRQSDLRKVLRASLELLPPTLNPLVKERTEMQFQAIRKLFAVASNDPRHGVCQMFVDQGKHLIQTFKEVLDEFCPDWKSNGFISETVKVLEGAVNRVAALCSKEFNCFAVSPDVETLALMSDDVATQLSQILGFKYTPTSVYFDNSDTRNCAACARISEKTSMLLREVTFAVNEAIAAGRVPQVKFNDFLEVYDKNLKTLQTHCPVDYYLEQMFNLNYQSVFCLAFGRNTAADWKKKTFDLIGRGQEVQPTSNLRASAVELKVLHNSESSSTCFSCKDLVKSAEEAVDSIEHFLSSNFPEWEDIPLLPQIDDLIHDMLDKIQKKCPQFLFHSRLPNHRVVARSSQSCLSEENSKKVKGLQQLVHKAFDNFQQNLSDLEKQVDNSQFTEWVDNLKSGLSRLEDNLSEDIEVDSDQICVDCKLISSRIGRVADQIQSSFPDWKNTVIVSEIVDQLLELQNLFQKFCPLEVASVQPIVLELATQGCLTADQKLKLGNITSQAKVGLDVVAEILDLRADFEPDPIKKYTMKEASKVIKIVGGDLITNLTRLADEFCGDCHQLIFAVKDSFETLENALFDVEPLWRKTPIYSGVLQITDDVFSELDSLCSKTTVVKADCLSPEEKEKVKYYVGNLDKLLLYAADTLKTYAEDLPNGEARDEIITVATALKAVSRDLVENFTKIADESCGTCLDLVKALRDFENAVETFMNDVDSDWRNNPNYSSIASALELFISLMESLCPSSCKLLDWEKQILPFLLKTEESVLNLQSSLLGISEVNSKNLYIVSRMQKDPCPDRLELTILLSSNLMSTFQAKDCASESISTAVTYLDNALSRQISTLAEAAEIEGDETRKQLTLAALEALEIAQKKVELLSKLCLNCDQAVEIISEALEEVKKFLESLFPALKTNRVFEAIVSAVNSVMSELHDLCPNQV